MTNSPRAEAGGSSPAWRGPVAIWVAVVAAILALMGLNLLFSDVNQDEGWYLYAARQVAAGRLPFVDFASTQAPVLPFVYVLAEPLVQWQGLAGGRLFTAILGLIAMAQTAWLGALLSRRTDNRRLAAFLALVLCGVNVYQSAFFVMVKTYSLCAVFLTGSFLLLAAGVRNAERRSLFFWSGILAALAAGTRFSAVAAIPVTALVLLRPHVVEKPARQRTAGLLYVAGAMVGVAAVFAPLALAAPAALKFGLVDYHAGRAVGGLAAKLAYRAGFISRVVGAYFVPVSLLVAGIVLSWLRRARRDDSGVSTADVGARGVDASAWALWGAVAAVTTVHVAAPFPYDDYQVMIFPLLAAALGAWLADWTAEPGLGLPRAKLQNAAAVGVFLVCLLSAGSSHRNQDWFIGPRDRIWWPMRDSSPLAVLRAAGQQLKALPDRGNMLLTQDVYLAVEAGMDVPPGFEMGPFSYFPDMSLEQASVLHVVNREMMLDAIGNSPATYAAFSGYGLAIRAPSITPLSGDEQAELQAAVDARYEELQPVSGFGQSGTMLRKYRMKQPPFSP